MMQQQQQLHGIGVRNVACAIIFEHQSIESLNDFQCMHREYQRLLQSTHKWLVGWSTIRAQQMAASVRHFHYGVTRELAFNLVDQRDK